MRAQAMFSWAKPRPLNCNYVQPLNNPAVVPLAAAVTLVFRTAPLVIHPMMISACQIARPISSAIPACQDYACRQPIMAVSQAMTQCRWLLAQKVITAICATLMSACQTSIIEPTWMPARKVWLGLMIMAAARPIAHKALTVMAMACANPTTPKNAPRISPAIQLPANACRPVCGHQSLTIGCACPSARRERSAIFAIQHYACRHLQLASKAMKKSAVAVCQFAIRTRGVTLTAIASFLAHKAAI